ncbi:MAG: hypothetical protein CL927_04900, partial [Deltaproteobacteria bacterium]|nr:hypothetical protein [Deltaproteobacteria bacterium]
VALAQNLDQYTSCWVKGKYYDRWLGRTFMHSMSNIPIASRGYLIATAFQETVGRPPSASEYRQLRNLVDRAGNTELDSELRQRLVQPPKDWAQRIEDLFAAHSHEVVRLTGEALTVGLQVLVFPEGTRSVRLTRGRIGIAEIANHYRVPVIPVGCSGSHRVYPGNSPWPRPGTIRYRVGRPLHPDDPDLASFAVAPGFTPFAHQTRMDHGPKLQGFVDTLMDRIAQLVDADHTPETAANGGADVGRFI